MPAATEPALVGVERATELLRQLPRRLLACFLRLVVDLVPEYAFPLGLVRVVPTAHHPYERV